MCHYTESGLPNIWLADGYKTRPTKHSVAVSILDADGLHQATGRTYMDAPGLPSFQFMTAQR